jgi:predicted PurR-regulated permease PerM
MLLVPVFAFYLLVDWDHFVGRARALVPPRHRAPVTEVVGAIDAAVSTWIRGQLMVMAILAMLYAAAFKIIGIQLGVTIGVIVGLLTIIPFLGTFVGAAITVLVIVLDWQGPNDLIAAGIVFVVLHIVEAAVLTPKIVGKKVGLGELGALFAVLAGGKLLGFTGVLLAVPLAASVAVLVRRGVRSYEASIFFTQGAELEPRPPRRPARDQTVDLGLELQSRVDAALAPEPKTDPDSDPDLDADQ